MGKEIHVYLTNEELKKMKDIADKLGSDNKSRIVKLAIKELHVNADTLNVHRPYKEGSGVLHNPDVITIKGLEKK
jgi:hypothetical protein